MDKSINISVNATDSKENVSVNTPQISVKADCTGEAGDIQATVKAGKSDNEEKLLDDKKKFLYEKAIEGRNFHQQSFNHWMNMYAIFNGALFMSFTYLKSYAPNSKFLHFMILLLGCVASWFWHFSVCGFYKWILSWIGVVLHHENAYIGTSTDNKQYVYRLFVSEKADENKPMQPFSTQKLTSFFTIAVAISWGILTVWQFLHCMDWFVNFASISFIKPVIYILLLVMTVVFIVLCAARFCKERNLRDTHKIELVSFEQCNLSSGEGKRTV